MRNLFFILIAGAGAWQWSQGGFSFSSSVSAFDESGNPVVKVLTVDDCGKPCQMAISELKRRRVDFEEIQIDPHQGTGDAVDLWKAEGQGGFPLIVSGEEKINGSGTPAQVATLLGLNFNDKYFSSAEKRYYKKHFYEGGSPRVVMYGADWCPYTKKLREELQANNIDFVEIDVDKSGQKEKISRTMGISGYPTTWVGYTRVNGSSLKDVDKVLKNY